MIPYENVKINVVGKNQQKQFICVVIASYTLGFLMTKRPELVFRMKHKVSKEIFFGIFFYGKNACHTIS